jgi:4-amino-4-deoxy-L-arabinose transferase-like glycosyltransferase
MNDPFTFQRDVSPAVHTEPPRRKPEAGGEPDKEVPVALRVIWFVLCFVALGVEIHFFGVWALPIFPLTAFGILFCLFAIWEAVKRDPTAWILGVLIALAVAGLAGHQWQKKAEKASTKEAKP